ncbi:protoporphyrinogen oxidase [Nocardioides mangrovicus]|uniref:Coproporphyrinogen III oxidase n=1 Tax=Nocardioides mangrovicus TaxID=2478913 RepID=A0A3L8P234_9ACTN|nr:protoporphyrinogen oxidase [Nocardioides mangrovicus]
MVVVGGGIAGVAAAHRVTTLAPDAEVVLLEGSPRLGGKLALAEVGGLVVDTGAEALLQRRPEAVDLARAVGLSDDLVEPATISASLWSRGELSSLPRTLMGIPTDGDDDGRPVVLDADVSVGDLVAAHLGEDVVQRLVEPMLGGVYAGHAHQISTRAAVPQLVRHLDGTRTLTEAAAAAMTPSGAGGPVFAGIRGGVGRLPLAVAADLSVETDAVVRELHRTPTGFELVVGPTRAERRVEADAVVLATPARPTARLLADVAATAAAELAEIEYASMAVVTLAVRDLPATTGSGFLVPPVEGRTVKGATYSFAKWGWVGEHDLTVLRCSIGRHREEQVLQRDDDEVVALAAADLSDALGGPVVPVDSHVQRWGGGLPQYAVGHVERVARIRADVERVPGLAVCGAAYDGVGVPAAIGTALAAAERVVSSLDGRIGS